MSNLDRMNVFGNSSNAEKSDYNEFASVGKAEPNRKYKDTFFCKLFSEPKYTLKLYQQLHPEDKKATVDDIELNTLDNVFKNDQYNDISFLVDNRLIVLVEHQSTICHNMPLRMLMYVTEEYARYIDSLGDKVSIYQNKLIKLPKPEFYVVYTGDSEEFKNATLRLSDAFGGQSSLEVEVKVLCGEDASTIETGYNNNNDRVIDDYCNMIRCIEHNRYVMGLEGAITYAIHLFENTSLGDYLRRKKNEVENMLKDEYKEEDRVKALVQEGKEKGIDLGMAKAIKTFKENNPTISNKELAHNFNLTYEELQKYLEMNV